MQIIENLNFITGGNQDLENIDLGDISMDISIVPVDLTNLKDLILENGVISQNDLDTYNEEIVEIVGLVVIAPREIQ